jgi:hypothetical protein
MKTEDTSKVEEGAAKEENAKESQGFPEMCHQMMVGGMPPCCKAQMKDMMAQWKARFQAGEG